MGSSPDGTSVVPPHQLSAPAALRQQSSRGAPFEAKPKPAWVALPAQEICITRAGATDYGLLWQPRT